MKLRRALLLVDPRVEPALAVSALHRVAPALERVVVVERVRGLAAEWSSEGGAEPNARDLDALEDWRCAVAGIAALVDVRPAPELSTHSLVDLALGEDVDLLVAGARTLAAASLLVDTGRRLGVPVLWPAGEPRDAPLAHVLCAAFGERSLAAIIAFFRDRSLPSIEASVVGPAVLPRAELAAALDVLGIRAHVELLPRTVLDLRAALAGGVGRGPFDLIVLARAPALLLDAYPWPAPVLVVPPVAAPTARAGALDIADVVDAGGAIRAHVDEVTALGTSAPAANALVAFVGDGRLLGTAITSDSGEVELPAGAGARWIGAVRVTGDAPPDPLAAAEQRFAVLRPDARGVLLYDADTPPARLTIVRDAAREGDVEPLAVRVRPTMRASDLRDRLRAAELPPRVVDARVVLGEGPAFDVAEANDPVRLRRVASSMRRAGFRIASVLDRTMARPEPFDASPPIAIEGNRVTIELDNAQARRWLLDAIAQSRRAVDVQVYMAADDEVGRAFEAAIAEAAARGVTTRVLVDSLHGMHGSFGAENPLLARLGARPGVALRVSRPLTSFPSVVDLKQRDHRKIVIVDDRLALVGGRNLAHEYYAGFDEVRLDPGTAWRQVPWLDAGARVEGPAVAAIAASFRDAWVEAGGAPFAIDAPPPIGTTAARVVVHRGLRDAATLDAYRDLVDRARSHVWAVNGFPYVLELQHALVRALRRGVRVRVLTGHLTPMHGVTPFAGPWSSARATATEFVHSRLDPIVDAGGDVYLFAQKHVAGDEPHLGPVSPHVHAKLMSVDGRWCAVGSANLDVTSSYWESELMVVVDDAGVVTGVDSTLDALVAGSPRVDRDDPAWRERARRRAWMRRWPGALGV
jgi:phosphatidylserine/phosphatidylglycerophosphate/cardiolipin synthase-like enzyme